MRARPRSPPRPEPDTEASGFRTRLSPSVSPGPIDRPGAIGGLSSGRHTKSKWRLCPREDVTADTINTFLTNAPK
jgi:hypothetical protein